MMIIFAFVSYCLKSFLNLPKRTQVDSLIEYLL